MTNYDIANCPQHASWASPDKPCFNCPPMEQPEDSELFLHSLGLLGGGRSE